MRYLAVADLHYSLKQYDWVLDVAPHFDMVVIAGDHLDTNSLVDCGAQIVVVQKYLERLRERTMVITCSGNHDLDEKNATGEKVTRWLAGARNERVRIDGESLVFDGSLITICPWWDGPVVREQIGRQLADDAKRRDGRWIWIHHAPPDKSPIAWGGNRYFGDVELKQWITEFNPDMVISGHVHQAPFVQAGSWVDRIGDTWVFNAGRQYGEPPTHIVIDTDEAMALWFSAAGNQFVHVDRALERPVQKLSELPAWLTGGDRIAARSPG
jgi:Icc-related predicted phosphoesterase